MTIQCSKNLIAIAIASALSLPVSAADKQESESTMEEVTVVAKKLSHAAGD